MASSLLALLNDESSSVPLYLFTSLWLCAYLYSLYDKEKDFARWYALHTFHNVGAVLIGITSLYFDDDSICNERISILWSLTYFVIDLFDCVMRLDKAYSLHAFFCVFLGCCNYNIPLLKELRMNSKAAMCEISSPFMTHAKKTRKPLHFALFVVMFTLCRIVWIPLLVKQLRGDNVQMDWLHPIMLALLGFFGLNLYWWFKMIRILVDGLRTSGEAKNDEKAAKNE